MTLDFSVIADDFGGVCQDLIETHRELAGLYAEVAKLVAVTLVEELSGLWKTL